MWHDRIGEGRHVHAQLHEPPRHPDRDVGIAEHHRNDRVVGTGEREPGLRHRAPEVPGVVVERGPSVLAVQCEVERCTGATDVGRRERIGEQVWPTALSQQVDHRLAGGHESAHCSSQRLAEGAGHDVHAVGDIVMARCAAALGPEYAGRMAVVDHDQGAVLVGQLADRGQVGEVPVHREDPIGHDEDGSGAVGTGGLQLRRQVAHVTRLEPVAAGLGEPDAVDDRRVVQRVADDRVLRSQQRLEDRPVRIEAGGEGDARLSPDVGGDVVLERAVLVGGSTDEAHRCHSVAQPAHRRLGLGDDVGMVGQSEVVVCAEVDYPAGARHRDLARLG